MKHSLRVGCLSLLLIAMSCKSSSPSKDTSWFSAGKPTPPITHVVLIWLKTPGDPAAREKVIDASKTFVGIPGVVSVRFGEALPSTRPVVDSSFDVAVVIRFTDEEALRAYDQHPTHKKAVDEVLKPLSAKVQIYDIKERR
jgi:hypothetical protein